MCTWRFLFKLLLFLTVPLVLAGCGGGSGRPNTTVKTTASLSCPGGNILGSVVEASTGKPLDGLRAAIALEALDTSDTSGMSTYRPVADAITGEFVSQPIAIGSTGLFVVCPPAPGKYLLVVAGTDSAPPIPQDANAYPPSLVFADAGTNVGSILVGPEGRKAAPYVTIGHSTMAGPASVLLREWMFDIADEGAPGSEFRYAVPSVAIELVVGAYLWGPKADGIPDALPFPAGPGVFRLPDGSWVQRAGPAVYTDEMRAFVYEGPLGGHLANEYARLHAQRNLHQCSGERGATDADSRGCCASTKLRVQRLPLTRVLNLPHSGGAKRAGEDLACRCWFRSKLQRGDPPRARTAAKDDTGVVLNRYRTQGRGCGCAPRPGFTLECGP